MDIINPPVGNCPVQSEGVIDGHPYYFRSRGSHWTFKVAEKGEKDAVSGKCIYGRFGYVGEWPAAGWLPEKDAEAIIMECVAQFKSGVRGTVWCECPEDVKRKAMSEEERYAYDYAKAASAFWAPNPLFQALKKAKKKRADQKGDFYEP